MLSQINTDVDSIHSQSQRSADIVPLERYK